MAKLFALAMLSLIVGAAFAADLSGNSKPAIDPAKSGIGTYNICVKVNGGDFSKADKPLTLDKGAAPETVNLHE
jgi:hypothetical protein